MDLVMKQMIDSQAGVNDALVHQPTDGSVLCGHKSGAEAHSKSEGKN